LLGAKSYDTAIQIRPNIAGFVAQATKIGELYSNLPRRLSPVKPRSPV
jgi:hypothetical protein